MRAIWTLIRGKPALRRGTVHLLRAQRITPLPMTSSALLYARAGCSPYMLHGCTEPPDAAAQLTHDRVRAGKCVRSRLKVSILQRTDIEGFRRERAHVRRLAIFEP